MIVEGREIIHKETFLDSLIAIQNYVGAENTAKGRALVNEIFNFTMDIIAPMPFAFVKFSTKFYPNSDFRKAVFKKKYIIIYLVLNDKIEFWEIYHTNRNPDNILLIP